jgi:hypothetical protein
LFRGNLTISSLPKKKNAHLYKSAMKPIIKAIDIWALMAQQLACSVEEQRKAIVLLIYHNGFLHSIQHLGFDVSTK